MDICIKETRGARTRSYQKLIEQLPLPIIKPKKPLQIRGGTFTFTVLEHFESMSLNLWCRDEVYLVYERSTTAHSI